VAGPDSPVGRADQTKTSFSGHQAAQSSRLEVAHDAALPPPASCSVGGGRS
jgi:hypothetical protein